MNFNPAKIKSLLGAGAILSLIFAQQVFQAAPAQADDQATFNTFTPYTHTREYNRDYYLLGVKNETKNSSWGSSASADAGDTLVFYLYYHNSHNGSTARNTTLRVSLPTSQSTYQTVSGYLWADNATGATYSSPLSQSVQLNLSSSQSLSYISNSALWYANQQSWPSGSTTAFPSGQSGDNLFNSGVNLGDIQACWEFSGAVVFKARIGNTTNSNLSISKTVQNLTQGSSISGSVNANPGDKVEFTLRVNSSSNSQTVNNVRVWDILPSGLTYVPGSTRVDGSWQNDGVVSGGINLGSLYQSQAKNIIFDATVNSGLNTQTLSNWVYVSADNVSQQSSMAQVLVNNSTPAIVSACALTKKVENLSSPNGTNFSNSALPGDTLRYTISYTNCASSILNNVQIIDVLPSYTTFKSAENNGYLDSAKNMITWNLGNLGAQNIATVSYQVQVSNVPSDGFNIENTAAVSASNLSLINSNEVETRVNAIKTGPVAALTGSDSKTASFAFSALGALGFIFLFYLLMERADFWRDFELKMAVYKAKKLK